MGAPASRPQAIRRAFARALAVGGNGMNRLLDAARSEPAPTLGAEARSRIAGQLAALGAPARARRRARVAAVTALACAAAATAFYLGRHSRPRPARPTITPVLATQELVVPACNVVRVSERGRFAAAIVGPARVT